MKQILQNRRTGEISVADVPTPSAQRGRVIVRTAASLISAGTEKTAIDEGKSSLIDKARNRPDLVRKVIDKARTEGIVNTVNSVREKLNSSLAFGYSAAGTVIETGEGVTGFRSGDRVACAGVGYASHAEVLSVPKNLCVHIPEKVDFDAACFGTLGAIALQGVRLAEPTLGESVVVIGLGLLGQLTVQLLRANGCRVYGLDLNPARVALAMDMGADKASMPGEESVEQIWSWTRGRRADAVLITAATDSNQPVELAGEISRLKGRVVAVGLVGLQIPRQTYFSRELTFRVSMSYGPGRYDPEYEDRGHDYPYAYVRWTEGRNIEAFLDLIAGGQVRTAPLITHTFPIDDGVRAYELISGENSEPHLGVVLHYNGNIKRAANVVTSVPIIAAHDTGRVRIGLIGAGDYAKAMLLPHFRNHGAEFVSIATASGVNAHDTGRNYGFSRIASGADEVIADPEVNLVVIATRHDSHAELARKAMEHGKSVFVEKPLALNESQLNSVLDAVTATSARLTVGYNRRFSPHGEEAAAFFRDRNGPLSIVYRINAGRVPGGHWIHDPDQGGGRILGEVCHFVDFVQFVTGSIVTSVYAEGAGSGGLDGLENDSALINLRLADGSTAVIAYLAEGDRALAKERIEIFGGGRVFIIDDFASATAYGGNRDGSRRKLKRQDKGQAAEVKVLCEMITENRPAPVSIAALANTSRTTFRILESMRTGRPVALESDPQ